MWLKAHKLTLLTLLISFSTLAFQKSERAELSLEIKNAKDLADSSPDSALLIANAILEKLNKASQDSLKGQAFIAISTSYSYLADYQNSTSAAFQAIKVAEKFKDTVTLIDGFNNLGIDFMFQEDYEKSIKYFQEVNGLSQQFGDSLRWGHALNNLGLTYGYMGETEKELDFYDKAAVIFLKIGEDEGYGNTLLNSGTAYTILEQFEEAQKLYEKAMAVFEEIEMTSGIQNTLLSMAENYLGANLLSKAEEHALEALKIAMAGDFSQDILYTYDLLSQIAEKNSDYQAALEYHQSARETSEGIFTREKSMQIEELETKYQSEKKERELATASLQLEQQNREKYIWIAAFILILCISITYFYATRHRARLQQKLLAEEIENLRLKINSLLGDSKSIQLSMEELNKKLHQPLTNREFEILNFTISDKTNKEIADEVHVSVNTVKYHLKNVYEKLGVSNRKEALHLLVTQN